MKHIFLSLLLLGIALQLVGCRVPLRDEPMESTTTPIAPRPTPDPDREELEELEERLNTTDLSVEISVDTNPTRVHGQLTITVKVMNHGPNPASEPQLIYRLPDGTTYISSSVDCLESPSRTVICELDELLARDSVTIRIEALVEESAPTTIRNVAQVDNLAGPDPNPENDTATIDVQIGQ